MKKTIVPLALLITLNLQSQPITFCAGSCADLRDDEAESIFIQIAEEEKSFFLWLGDNLYFKKEDWQGESEMRDAYQQRFSTQPVQALLKSSRQLAIYDDHDFGPNDSDSSFTGRRFSAHAFAEQWKETPTQVERYGDIRWAERYGSTLMIGLDDRFHRGPVGTQILGRGQLNWLAKTLSENSDASIVFIAVGSQVLNDAKVFENYARFQERDEFMSLCARAGMPVVFLTGDRHHGEISQKRVDGVTLTEITASPLTSTTHDPSKEELKANRSLVKNTVVSEAHYARIHWDGLSELTVDLVGKSGTTIVNKKIYLLPL
ncbi:MAG: alkaline phosphatase D family protein [Schleiferiaceae bacterium]|nr:alkaline phosphatase D family protein [Schleiferiaceae bacterium]